MSTDPKERRIGRGFDRLSWFYDAIIQLVFGNTMAELERAALEHTPRSQHILIMGGGTGRILRQCFDLNLSERYSYAELSTKMVERTRQRLSPTELQHVTFTQRAFQQNDLRYDAIIFPFILDCYSPSSISNWVNKAVEHLAPDGQIVLLDFNQEQGTEYTPSIWKEAFIWTLYRFFRASTGIEARSLAPFQSIFKKNGLIRSFVTYRKKGWLQGVIWRIPPTA